MQLRKEGTLLNQDSLPRRKILSSFYDREAQVLSEKKKRGGVSEGHRGFPLFVQSDTPPPCARPKLRRPGTGPVTPFLARNQLCFRRPVNRSGHRGECLRIRAWGKQRVGKSEWVWARCDAGTGPRGSRGKVRFLHSSNGHLDGV